LEIVLLRFLFKEFDMLHTQYPRTRTIPAVVPWKELGALTNRVSRVIDEALEGVDNGTAMYWSPAFDVVETKDDIVLYADLPGMDVGEIEIELENNVLSVSGQRLPMELGEGQRRVLAERLHGRFNRTFTLPRTVDPERITARFDNGCLTVSLPKVAEAKGRKIEIRSEA
jgi:HSP20 family protein